MAMLMYATKTQECAPTAQETQLEIIVNSVKMVTTATHFWEVMTNASPACVPTDQAAAGSSLMDANKTTSWTELSATAWKDMQAICVTSAHQHTGEILTNPTECAENVNVTTMSTHSTQRHVTLVLAYVPDVFTILLDHTARDAKTSTTEVPSI